MSTKNLSKRAKEALDHISFSKLLRIYEYGDFVEATVDRWGDVCTFRIYNNGDVTER